MEQMWIPKTRKITTTKTHVTKQVWHLEIIHQTTTNVTSLAVRKPQIKKWIPKKTLIPSQPSKDINKWRLASNCITRAEILMLLSLGSLIEFVWTNINSFIGLSWYVNKKATQG